MGQCWDLKQVGKEGMADKQRSEGSEEGAKGRSGGKSIPGRGQWKCKCPGVGCTCGGLVRGPPGEEGRPIMKARSCRASQGPGRSLTFTLSEKGTLWG